MSYTIIDKCILPDGTPCQLEDWPSGYTIAAYPKSKANIKFTSYGERFRLGIAVNNYKGYTDTEVKRDYDLLKQGKITLTDLADHYWFGEEDKMRMGLVA